MRTILRRILFIVMVLVLGIIMGSLPSYHYFSFKNQNNTIYTIKPYGDEFFYEASIFSTVQEVKDYNNFKIGDKVRTIGYYEVNDGGAAMYEIVTFDDYIASEVLNILEVDEFGSHSVNDNLVAKLIINERTTPEQWGAKGDGKFNNCIPFIHMFAKIKSGIIDFKPGAKYAFEDIYPYKNPYKEEMIGNPLGGYDIYKPLMANINGVIINGNNSTMYVKDEGFAKSDRYDVDFSFFMLGGNIENLKIKDLIIDGNGFNQKIAYSKSGQRNHGIAYIGGTLEEEYNFENILIEECTFKDTGYNTTEGDCGGDGILVIIPTNFNNIKIINNKFINPGRWAVAWDLGGNGEISENIDISSNYFIQQEDQIKKTVTEKERGLGFIDFEVNKSWRNLTVSNNTVDAAAVGIAIGGGETAKIENLYFENNNITKRDTPNYAGYFYIIDIYNQDINNLYFKNNNINIQRFNGALTQLGRSINSAYITNNAIIGDQDDEGSFFSFNNEVLGEIYITDNNFSACSSFISINNPDVPRDIDLEKISTKFYIYKNIIAKDINLTLVDNGEIGKYNYIDIRIADNEVRNILGDVWDCENVYLFNNKHFVPVKKNGSWHQDNNQVWNIYIYVRGASYQEAYPLAVYDDLSNKTPRGGRYKKGGLIADLAGKSDEYKYMICTKSGSCIDLIGQWPRKKDIEWSSGLDAEEGIYYFTDDKLYLCVESGKLGNSEPDSTEGIQVNGNAKVRFCDYILEWDFWGAIGE